uniref:Uncharacterized protein n=1 Tax=Staphylothermus marinus TaxID=2280 RepID=A0A7C4JLB5_STAMA
MRYVAFLLLLLFLSILTLYINSNQVYASPEIAVTVEWVNPIYRGYDDYYGRYVIAYPESGIAEFRVRIEPYGWNVVHVEVRYISIKLIEETSFNIRRENISVGDWRIYSVNVSIPKKPDVYSYVVTVIYKEYYWDGSSSDELIWKRVYENLAVYSKEQITCIDYFSIYETMRVSYSAYLFTNPEAILLLYEAEYNYNRAKYLYSYGKFGEARDTIINATELFRKAVDLEKKYRIEIVLNLTVRRAISEMENNRILANASYLHAQANYLRAISEMENNRTLANATYLNAQASYLNAQANYLSAEAEYTKSRALFIALLLFGAGFIITSIGLAIHMIRKK